MIGRNTAFTYKGKAVESRGCEPGQLNIQLCAGGTVQRDGNRMRINVQLVDTETGTHPLGRPFRQACGRPFRHAGRDRMGSAWPTRSTLSS